MKSELVFKNNIKKYRLERKHSQEELAKTVGKTRQTIIAIKKTILMPQADLRICFALR